MALIKTRPVVRVRAPTELMPGRTVELRVELDCRRPLEVEYVDVTIVGTERYQASDVARTLEVLRLGARVLEARELPEGRTAVRVEVSIPAECPPSYRGVLGSIDYEAEVHVAIPWWPDLRKSFELFVAPTPRQSPPEEPRVYSSNPGGPSGGEPFAELSLSTVWSRVGERLEGAWALSNTERNHYVSVELALISFETGPNGRRTEALRYRYPSHVERLADGEMIPFRLRVPTDGAANLPIHPRPGGGGGMVGVSWILELRAKVRFGPDVVLHVPIAVLPRSENPADAPPRLAPPTIGSDRLRGLWTGVGAPLGFTYDAHTLRTRVGESTLTVRREHRGREPVQLVAELRYPDLHLDLFVERASRVERMLGSGKTVGLAEWDAKHLARARCQGQLRALLTPVVPRLQGTRLHHFDDSRLVVGVRDGGHSGSSLRRFLEGSLAVARVIEERRRYLPPPEALVHAVDRWNELATRLGGELEPARMRIVAPRAASTARVGVSFDGDGIPKQTWVGLVLSTTIDDEYLFRLDAPMEDPAARLAERFEGELVAALAAAAHGVTSLEIARDRISVTLPAALGLAPGGAWLDLGRGDPPAITPASIEGRIDRLAQLAVLLRGQAGPYR